MVTAFQLHKYITVCERGREKKKIKNFENIRKLSRKFKA